MTISDFLIFNKIEHFLARISYPFQTHDLYGVCISMHYTFTFLAGNGLQIQSQNEI